MFSWILYNIIPFLVLLTVMVFVHELGHYIVARLCGVRVDVFSIGFGKELFGFTDRYGTRWKFCLFLLGGYVKMFGDTNEASAGAVSVDHLSPEEQKLTFVKKSVSQRAAIVFAGPFANFLYAIVILAGLFMAEGQLVTKPFITKLAPDGPAARAGLMVNDLIVGIDGQSITRFQELQQEVSLKYDQVMILDVIRENQKIQIKLTPQMHEIDDGFGSKQKIGYLGIYATGGDYVKYPPFQSIWMATQEVYNISKLTLTSIGQMVSGKRGTDEISGPIRIAQMTSEVAQRGGVVFLWFSVFISINLGLVNLLPIPVLDGGHLFLYAVEMIRGKPLSEKLTEIVTRAGLVIVMLIMLLGLGNDILRLF